MKKIKILTKSKEHQGYIKAVPALSLFILLFIFSESVKSGISSSLGTIGNVIIPSLFPFLILSSFISFSGIRLPECAEKILCRITRLPPQSIIAVLCGLTGGFPVGIKSVCELSKDGTLSDEDARLLGISLICPGPAFTISAIGRNFFGPGKAGIILYAVNVMSFFIMFTILRLLHPHKKPETEIKIKAKGNGLSESLIMSVNSAVNTILSMSAWILFSGAVTDIVTSLLPFSFIKTISVLLSEVTKASVYYAGRGNIPLTAFAMGFGGFSVFFQLIPYMKMLKISPAKFLCVRFTAGGISYLAVKIITLISPVSLTSVAGQNFVFHFASSGAIAVLALMLFCAVFLLSITDNMTIPHKKRKSY